MRRKPLTEEDKIKNCLSSELQNMISEIETGRLTTEDAYGYFASFLIDAKVDSRIVVDVLEKSQFGEEGKYQAMCIKVNEGW